MNETSQSSDHSSDAGADHGMDERMGPGVTPAADRDLDQGTDAGADSSLARSSAVMAAGTVVSRLLGFARASMLAAVIGIGLSGDAFQVANTLPNQFYLLLAGGVLNAVLVPQITKAASHDDGGHEFVNRLLTLSLAILFGATLVVTAAAPLLVRLFSQHWDAHTLGLATAFAFLCLPQVFFYGLYTVLGQVLNARGRFAAYMWAPALANVVGIAGLLWFKLRYDAKPQVSQWSTGMILVVAGTATLGIVLQALVLWFPLRSSGFRYRPFWGWRGVGLGSASRVAGWTFAAVAVSQLGFVLTSKVMTRAGDLIDSRGSVGAGVVAYGLAFLLFMLPHSLITVSLVTALFTRISQAAHRGATRQVADDFSRGVRMPAVLLVPCTAAALVLGTQAVRVAFPGNSHEQAQAIAHVMIAMMVGLVPFGWLYLIQRVFYAFEDAKTPFLLQVVVTAAATAANLIALLVPPERAGVVVGIGQTLSNLVAALVGFALLGRRLGRLHLSATIRVYVRLVCAAVAAAIPAALALLLVERLGVDAGRWSGSLVELVLGGVVFLAVFFATARLMRVEEVGQLLDPVLRRVRRRRPTTATP
ncbi:murein biosynthesis integral membrane protein MurJ [Pedococcus sp. 5OH_020]|uniref:murein biosynthesis integral membrane protein MurJ n=1 Tax=Pedococcus sp. 5OH_020 TaxID=2989814 RepID=UPI0022E9A246|nr:murein biosynthesis integral membrane protein MurJ [Pedococcus sp. 5OH_020]